MVVLTFQRAIIISLVGYLIYINTIPLKNASRLNTIILMRKIFLPVINFSRGQKKH